MADRDSVIDALLAYLDGSLSADDRWAPAIRALVEDRNELRLMHAHLGQSYTMLAKECDALKQRVAVLDSQEFTLPTDPFCDPDRDLRERLVCAIWPEIMRQWREYKDAIDPRGCARADALEEANKMVALIREQSGGTC